MDNFASKFIKKMNINEKSVNFILILILGFLVGVAVKTEAKKRITIGYNDYLVTEMKQDFDLLKKEPPAPAQTPAKPAEPESDK
jgi:hypothetical protein